MSDKTRNCPHCRMLISKKASVCPYCRGKIVEESVVHMAIEWLISAPFKFLWWLIKSLFEQLFLLLKIIFRKPKNDQDVESQRNQIRRGY